MPILIELSPAEIQMAAFVGTQRTVQCLQKGINHRYGAKDTEAWQRSIEGAMGECALAKHLDHFWSKGLPGDTDVGPHDVRQTHHANGKLIVHPSDDDNRRFYLVTGLLGKYNIHGYMYGRQAKQQKYWCDPQGTNRFAYFVPQSDLIQDNVQTTTETTPTRHWLDD
jgi:hypothetical protein